MPASPESVLRKVETEVLDQYYRRFELLCWNESDAIESLLRCYGTVLRELRTGKVAKPNDDAKSDTANEGLRGLAYCLRWIRACCPSSPQASTATTEQIGQEALELLRWGVKYDRLYNHHTAYSRAERSLDVAQKMIGVEVDEPNKVITFLPKTDANHRFFVTQHEAQKADIQRGEMAYPEHRLSALSKAWYDSATRTANGVMTFDDATIRTSGALDVASEWLGVTCFPELEPSTSLGASTVGELRRLLAALHVFSLYATRIEDVADDLTHACPADRTCVIAYQHCALIDWLAALSEVPHASVKSAITILTFDDEAPRVTVAHKPFIKCRDGRLFLLPRMILNLNWSWTFAGALNLSESGQAVYSHVINSIESAGVTSIARQMRTGLLQQAQMVERQTWRLPDGKQIQPDLVFLAKERCEVLVIDAKYATPPFGTADVFNDMSDMEKWKTRMSQYVVAFEQHPEILGQHFSDAITHTPTVFGLILLRWPLPIPAVFPGQICAVDWPSLRDALQHSPVQTIGELMGWAHARPDTQVMDDLEWRPKEIRVDDWAYRYSVVGRAT